jgi:DNA-binding FadR family transcriptional regulator
VLKVLTFSWICCVTRGNAPCKWKGRTEKSLAGHRRILAAIKRHDAEAAKAAMRRHIEDVEEIILDRL